MVKSGKKKSRRHAIVTRAATGNRLGDSEINQSTRAVEPFSITTFSVWMFPRKLLLLSIVLIFDLSKTTVLSAQYLHCRSPISNTILIHVDARVHPLLALKVRSTIGSARIARLRPAFWLRIINGGLNLAHDLDQPGANFFSSCYGSRSTRFWDFDRSRTILENRGHHPTKGIKI